MAEPTLVAAYKDLVGDVGQFLGYGRGALNGETAFTTAQDANVVRSVKGGLRNFYFCSFDWSFLKPVATLTLLSGTSTLALPDDFGGTEGPVVVSTSGATNWWPIQFGGVGLVYQRQQQLPDTTGAPLVGCAEPLKGTGATQGQRWQLRVWPTPDQNYTLRFQYYLNPDYLSGALPYAYGGPQHAETLLESCLAVAEKIVDDEAAVHAQEFEKRLAVSKDIDRRLKPQTLGVCRDRSDMLEWGRPNAHGERWGGITVGGVQY